MPVTLDMVAQRAGVSAATVSRVLNNTGRVGHATRNRVLKAVEELKYHPNLAARTLAHGRSRTVGLIVSNLKNPFFLDIFQTLEGDAHHRGLEVVVANTDYQPKQLMTHVSLMRGRRLAWLGEHCHFSPLRSVTPSPAPRGGRRTVTEPRHARVRAVCPAINRLESCHRSRHTASNNLVTPASE